MLSLSAGFVPQFFKDQLAEVMPYCDYVFGNENEMKTWAESQGHGGDKSMQEYTTLMAKTEKKNSRRARVVVCTQGTENTIVAVAESGKEVEVKEYAVPVIESEKINDTNGAGDAFAGGFCAGVVQGKSLKECIGMGHWLARLSLQELGPSYVLCFSFHSVLVPSEIWFSPVKFPAQRMATIPLPPTFLEIDQADQQFL